MKKTNDKCLNCGHKRIKHRVREMQCLANDYYYGQGWIPCICSTFEEQEK